ncbi:MAG TPA: autotransporter-associated beta strand repeat-containing protein, partial [Rhizomicrobium sp.]
MGWLVFGRARKSLLRRATSIIATTALTVMPMLAYAPAAHATDYTGGDASYQTGGIFGNDGGHYGAPGGGGAQSTTGYYAAAGGAADAGGQGGMAVGGATGGNGGGAGGVGYYFTGGDFIVDGNITGGNGAAGLGGNFGPTNSYTGTGGGGGGGSGIWATGSGTITILQGESVTGGQGGQGNYSAGNGGLAGYTYTSTNGQGGHGIRADTATALTIDNAGSISGGSFMLGPAGGLGGAGIYGQNITLTNTGTITGGQDRGISAHAGVELTGGINVINNTSGTITSSTGGAAILIDGGTNAINISGGNITPGAYANAINVYGGTNIFNVTGGGVGAIYLGGGANTLTGSGFSNSVTLAHGATASIDAAQDDASGITTFDNYGGLTIESGRSLTVSTFTNENSATLTLNSGAQLIASTLNLLDGSTIAGAGTLSSGVAPLALSSGSISATVGGTGGLVKSGTGTLTLTGANTYTGGTTVDGGTLSIADGALGGGDVTLAEGTTIQFTGSSFTTTNDFHITGDPVFDVATGDTQTVSGVIDDATPSNPGIVEKTGNGTLVLSGANTYSGGTMIVAGILQLGVDSVFNTLGDPTSGIVSSAIGTDTLTFGGGTLQAGVDTILANAIDLNSADGTIDANGHDISLAGLISGTHGLSIVGSSGDMVTFANAGNSFSGGIDVTGSGVTISESANGDFGSGLVTLDGAGIKFNGADTYTNTVNVSGYSTFDLGGNAVTYTGLIADGSGPGAVMVSGGGTLTLKNTANSYTGGTYIFGGSTASIDSDGELGGTAGGVTLGDATTTGTLAITQNITSARTITLNIGGGVISAPFGKTLTLSGQVTGSGGLTVSGPGGVFLTGSANNYSGGTTIASGSVTAGRANVLGTGPLAIKAAGLLDLNNRSQSVGSLSDGGDVHGGIIANSGGGTAALTIGSDNSDSAFSGVIVSGSGTISLVKAGTGTLTLSGANTYSGGTTIGAGTLQIGVDSVFNTPGDPTSGIASSAIGTGTLTLNGGTLKTDAITTTLANDIVLGAGGTIDANAETLNLRGDITGSGALTITSSAFMPGAYIELGGNNTYSGATTISQGRVVALSSTALSASSDYSLTGTSSGHDWPMIDLNGFSQTIKSLTGNYFSYGVTNNGGSNATLTIAPGSGSTTNYGGGLSDGNTGHHSLAIVLDGASDAEQIFSSNFNTYSGGTTITSGILGVGASNALGTGAVYLDGGTLRAEGDFSLGNAFEVTRTGSTIDANGHSFTLGAISNTSGNELATLTFASSNGAGTVNLMSSEDFDGAIVIESSATVTQGTSPDNADVMTIHDLTLDGELQVTNARISKVSGSGTITNNAATSGAVTFDIDNGTETFAGTLADAAHGSLGVVKAGAGTLALSGNNTYSGGTAIDAGTIEAQSSSALGTGNVLIDGGKLRYDNGINLANAVVLGGDVAVDVEGSDTATQSGTVGDDTVAHTLTKTGTGTLTLSSANTYSGTTKLSAGTLEIDNADALGASQIVFDGGTLKVDGAYTIANDILIGANGGTFDTSTFDTTLSGTISDGGSGGFLAVSGTGKVTITGDNELSAGTDVAAGG